MKIGARGTARARAGRPPKEIRDVETKDFNSCAYTVDEAGTMVYRRVDNSVVAFESTARGKERSAAAERKKPRITSANRANIRKVWGDSRAAAVEAPEFIDDYNHAMNAVDRADQLIAACTMKHKCHRTRMPFLCYLLNIIRVNSRAARRELGGEMSHMEFALGIAMDLWARRNDGQARARGNDSSAMEFHRRPAFKRMRQSVEPLPAARLADPRLHKASFYEWKRGCCYCRRKAAKARIEKRPTRSIKRLAGVPSAAAWPYVSSAGTSAALEAIK